LPNRDKKNAYDDAATNPESTVDKREVLTSAKRTPARPAQRTLMPPLACYAPGLAALLHYKLADAPADLRAGLAVTAVERPVGIAYAELAGFRPAVGLYSSILPLLAYAIFGTSRQLILGPDAATCALVAASVAPLAAGDQAA
jgi:hypothetical protein